MKADKSIVKHPKAYKSMYKIIYSKALWKGVKGYEMVSKRMNVYKSIVKHLKAYQSKPIKSGAS